MQEFKVIQLDDLKSNTKFCHFTRTDSALKILSSSQFFLSAYSGMNDGLEERIHAEDSKRVFSLCFCHSESLNIPMFYLYSGIDGKGCRIQFTPKRLQRLLKEAQVFFVKNGKPLKRAVPNTAYEIDYDWIYYVTQNGYYEHFHDEVDVYKSKEEVEGLLRQNGREFFMKSKIWSYENEFRVIVKFKEDIECEKIALRFPMDKKERGISIKLGPEVTESDSVSLQEEFKNCGIQRTERLFDYEIRMGLLDKNKHIFKSSFNSRGQR